MYIILSANFIKSKNFLYNKILAGKFSACKMIDFCAIFYYTQNVGVCYLTSGLASVEAYREVGDGLSCTVERSVRGDLNSSHKSYEPDLSL